MPRRPRSTARAPTKRFADSKLKPVPGPSKSVPRSNPDHSEDSEEERDEEDDGEPDGEDGVSSAEGSAIGDEDDEDVDAPRVSQWVDDDELDPAPYEEDPLEVTSSAGSSQLKSLEHDLSNLPLGALLRAQRALKQANASDSESDNSSEEESDSKPEPVSLKGKEKEKEKPEWSIQPRHDIAKRTNKHAPVEVTSKRPVTRKRTVVEVKTVQARDPRFLPLAGEFLPQKFQESYGFLADAHKTELRTLRENLKIARKLLVSSPRELHAEREAEVGRLEMAVKRAESMVNQDRRAKVDQEALTKLNEAERAKQKEGKGGWWMKEADKKEFLVRARYDALAAEGGKRAVKKAIEKKQKKIGQKEKKSRPFAKGGLKRQSGDGEGGRPEKRRRI
ncbi:hypothetical protein DFH07DRAFT_788967 [Mycena maculata]|uniref:rRNA biogenesis protein RRP36 n=1 Tax=Mycena maculata TaxID=230809 RepID=A0AAD7KFU2_9AGAR|nr:hypothetical protein DFH07DRAFT_788967 [Mycena maculata]